MTVGAPSVGVGIAPSEERCSFLALHNEALLLVISYLDLNGVGRLSCVCRCVEYL